MSNVQSRNTAPVVLVWVVLTAATFFSWLLGHGDGPAVSEAVSTLIIGVAVVKAYLVGNYFMEVEDGPAELKWAFRVYLTIVAAALIGILLLT